MMMVTAVRILRVIDRLRTRQRCFDFERQHIRLPLESLTPFPVGAALNFPFQLTTSCMSDTDSVSPVDID